MNNGRNNYHATKALSAASAMDSLECCLAIAQNRRDQRLSPDSRITAKIRTLTAHLKRLSMRLQAPGA